MSFVAYSNLMVLYTLSYTLVKALDLVIIIIVHFFLFGITGVLAGVLAWEWYQGCCTSQNKIV